MSMDHDNDEAQQLVREIRMHFPDAATTTDQSLIARHWDAEDFHEFAYLWIDAFASRIGEAARSWDGAGIEAQTRFMAEKYRTGSAFMRSMIDVAYAENILADAKELKAWAWPFVAKEIRTLHEAIWGPPLA